MKALGTEGNWSFELKQVFCRKAANYGKPYTMSAVINIVDGEVYVELLSGNDNNSFTKSDYTDLKTFIKNLGFNKVNYSRYKGENKICLTSKL